MGRPARVGDVPVARLALALAAALLLAVVMLLARSSPVLAPTPPPTRAATATATATASASPRSLLDVPGPCRGDVRGEVFAAGSLEERTRALARWLAAHPGETASIVLTDELLTDVARRARTTVRVEDTRVRIEDRGFRLFTTVVAFGRFPISALLVPTLVDGTVRLAVRELDTDGLPGFLRPAVSDAVADAADPASWGLTMRIDGVVTRTGCAVAWGRG